VLNSLATNAASAGSAGDGGNGTFGLALFSLLFGLLNGTDGPASEWDLGVHEWARDGVTRGDSSSDEGDGDESSETEELNNSIGAANHSNYELFLRLAELIGPARPRHVPLDAVDRALPAVKYIALKSSRVVGDETCRICLTDYERDDDVRPLQCDHLFHKYCIDTWLSKHVNSCPLCRQKAVVESDGTVVNQKEE
jgi:hypothetical protein